MIDSIRKSLGIESMDDVTLLVDTFYEFGDKKKARLAKEEEERQLRRELESNNPGAANGQQTKEEKKEAEKKKVDRKNTKDWDVPTYEDDEPEEIDPLKPDVDLDDVVEILEDFHN